MSKKCAFILALFEFLNYRWIPAFAGITNVKGVTNKNDRYAKKKYPFQKGQSLTEALILSLALITVIYFTLLVFWIGTSILWMEHQLYQGIVCAAQHKGISLCKKTVLKQIKKLNPLGLIQSLKIKHAQNEWKGEIVWIFYKRKFLIQQTLNFSQ